MRSKHPKALPYLFFTEMWERFGFYVVQGMLVLYMTQFFQFSDNKSFTILGVFTSLAYIAPILGGFLADKIFGFKQAILWGAAFLIVGYGLLALPGTQFFYISLATIIIGTGLFKPNISSLLGALYSYDDPRRDSGFTFFYIGINVGVLIAGLSSGYIKNRFGWHFGFGIASLGLILGVTIFLLGLKRGDMGTLPIKTVERNFLFFKPFIILYCLLAIGVVNFLLQSSLMGQWVMPVLGIGLLGFVFALAFKQEANDRKRLLILISLIISSIVFWMIYWQMFFSVNLFIERLINKNVFGINVPTTAFYTLQSLFVIFLGPVFAWSWQALNESNRNLTPFLKFIVAIAFIGLAFLVLAFSTFFHDSSNLVNPLWIVLSYFFITVGEMMLSPIGLSAVTLLSPPRFAGMMMGIWFVAMGFGGHFAGLIAQLSSVTEAAKGTLTQLPIYRSAFLIYALLAFAVSVFMYIVHEIVKKVLND